MPRDEEEYIELEVTIKAATKKAVMIECEDADVDDLWIPLSVIDWEKGDVEPERGAAGTLHVAEWFAKKEGLY